MGWFRLFVLWLQWAFLGRRSVVLIDFDGEMNARLAHGIRQFRTAKRHGFGIANVALNPDGSTGGVSYVSRWEPLFPAQRF